jgi:hypothetical protein
LESLREQRRALETSIGELEDIQRQAQDALDSAPAEARHA